MSTEKTENEPALILATLAILLVTLGTWWWNTEDAANAPVVAKRITVIQVIGNQKTMSVKDRIENVFYGVQPPQPPRPEDTWEYARRTDG